MARPAEPVRRSQAELEQFFDLSGELLCIVGFDGRFSRVNLALERTLGYPKAELFARSVFDLTHPDDVERAIDAWGQLAEGRDVVGFESRVVCADGSVRRLEWNTVATRERGAVYCVARDTTQRRRTEAELVEAKRLLEASRDDLRDFAAEHAALRRVATLVTRGSSANALFAAVAREAGEVLGVDATHLGRFDAEDTVVSVGQWGPQATVPLGARFPLAGDSVSARVLRTGRPARMHGYDNAAGHIAQTVRGIGIRDAIGVPICVAGRLWGVMIASSTRPIPFPVETETRLQGFTELVATAVVNASAHAGVRALADEQAALRRVATMVAEGATAEALFHAVVGEIGTLLDVDAVNLGVNHEGRTMSPLAKWPADPGQPPVPDPMPIVPGYTSWEIVRTGATARQDDWSGVEGTTATWLRDHAGIRSTVGAPIKVEGELWGVIVVHSKVVVLPPDTEARLERFAALVGTALTNAQARGEVRRLADQQAALRRVATLVAHQRPQAEVFAVIAEEISRLLGVESIQMVRFDEGRIRVCVASAGPITEFVPIGTRVPLDGLNVSSLVFRTGRPARIDDQQAWNGPLAARLSAAGVHSVVGAPIIVEGRRWGAMLALTHDAPLPADTEQRIGQFTELMATAIANAEARAEVTRLADEQTALRRVAMLVAEGANPSAVFDAVTREVAELLNASSVSLARYDDDVLMVVAQHGAPYVNVGDTYPLGGNNVTSTVLRTGGTARLDEFEQASGRIGEVARDAAVRSVVAAPIVVEGRTWGVLAAVWNGSEPPPDDTEERLAGFAELLDTAIANADSRDQLAASRARVLAAGDEARRRVVRDLHDGAQQRQVSTIVALKLAQRARREDRGDVDDLLAEALGMAERAMAELRELAHGILPAVLTHGGLRAGVQALVSRLALPVDLDVPSDRISPDIEASAYFIVAEALTNVLKHAQATRATVTAAIEDGAMTLVVRDDGVGGAEPEGHGLIGIADRVDALGGQLEINSAAGRGTVLTARLPLGG